MGIYSTSSMITSENQRSEHGEGGKASPATS